jgi:probable phosphoglycerate mutase
VAIVSFLRHGSTAWNESGTMQGRRDIALSAAGRAEVARWRLPPGDAVAEWISSPLARAVDTARILGGRAPRVEPALIEMDWGAWEGRTLAGLRAQFGAEFTRLERCGLDFRPPGGESPRDVLARVARWLDVAARSDRPLHAVTHNGVLRALYACATGWDMTEKPPVKLRPASLHRFAVERGPRVTLLECNVPLGPRAAAGTAT